MTIYCLVCEILTGRWNKQQKPSKPYFTPSIELCDRCHTHPREELSNLCILCNERIEMEGEELR